MHGGNDLTVTGSIGVAVTSDPAAAPGVLLQQADIAMYEAKTAGRDGFRIFGSDLPPVLPPTTTSSPISAGP